MRDKRLSEAGTAGTVNGLRVTNAFDGWGRRTTLESFNGGNWLTAHGYADDDAGRLTSAADGDFTATCSVAPSLTPASRPL